MEASAPRAVPGWYVDAGENAVLVSVDRTLAVPQAPRSRVQPRSRWARSRDRRSPATTTRGFRPTPTGTRGLGRTCTTATPAWFPGRRWHRSVRRSAGLVRLPGGTADRCRRPTRPRYSRRGERVDPHERLRRAG
ncbi:alpha-lytic protease prodomain-containing protein [Saccharopolyspora pogona]|uniref:alpha-lytic protease prodomain-containing protein n=1 Tax=Saccharopolyspora pogona TaxID=333966 RepID=UPI0021E088BD|nr:alpha-lytic protease prodomain-containing protein [Saccharopolyspora pogona]